jgi:hypothetical protein
MSKLEQWTERVGRWPAPMVLASALGIGMAWGALARVWMRLISTDPEFTVSGSVFIVGAFTVAAVAQAIALVARRWRAPLARLFGRVVGILGMVPLFTGAGAIMLPTVVGGGLAVGQREWPRAARVLATMVAMAPVLGVTVSLVNDLGPGPRLLAGFVVLVGLYGGIVAAVSVSLGRDPDAKPLPRSVRIATIAVGVGVLLFATVGIAGLRAVA